MFSGIIVIASFLASLPTLLLKYGPEERKGKESSFSLVTAAVSLASVSQPLYGNKINRHIWQDNAAFSEQIFSLFPPEKDAEKCHFHVWE